MKFEYKNLYDEVHEWEVPKAVETEEHISGYAVPNLGFRTFRKDRVLRFFPDDYVVTPKIPGEKDAVREHRRKARKLEVCFTGFSAQERKDLEEKAEAEHGLQVRKNVTNSLDYLVAGKNAGWAKMKKAEEQGVLVLDEKGYHFFLKTGYDGQ